MDICLQFFTLINNVIVNIVCHTCLPMPLCEVSIVYIGGNATLSSTLRFYQIILPSAYTNLYSSPTCSAHMHVSNFQVSTSLQIFDKVKLKKFGSLMHILILIYIFLVTNAIEHLFLDLLAIYTFSLFKFLSISFVHFNFSF